MIISNALDLYDQTILIPLKEKFNSITDINWIFTPPDLAIRHAKEQFNSDEIFPMYSVFRNEPPVKADIGSFAGMRLNYNLNEDQSMRQVMVTLKYQVDFWCANMFQLNKSFMDFIRFRVYPTVYFDFGLVGIEGPNVDHVDVPVYFEEAEDVSAIEEMYDIGRYFRYTYNFKMNVLVFDLDQEYKYDTIVFGIYNTTADAQNLLYEKEFPVES